MNNIFFANPTCDDFQQHIKKTSGYVLTEEWDVTQLLAVPVNTILARADKERKYPGLNISNLSNSNLWVSVGNMNFAITSFPSVKIPPGSNIDIPTAGRVYGIWEGTILTLTGYAQVIEFI